MEKNKIRKRKQKHKEQLCVCENSVFVTVFPKLCELLHKSLGSLFLFQMGP